MFSAWCERFDEFYSREININRNIIDKFLNFYDIYLNIDIDILNDQMTYEHSWIVRRKG